MIQCEEKPQDQPQRIINFVCWIGQLASQVSRGLSSGIFNQTSEAKSIIEPPRSDLIRRNAPHVNIAVRFDESWDIETVSVPEIEFNRAFINTISNLCETPDGLASGLRETTRHIEQGNINDLSRNYGIFEARGELQSNFQDFSLGNYSSQFSTKRCIFKSHCTWRDAFRMFNENKGVQLIFRLEDDATQNYASGNGANRYVYHKVANELIDDGILKRTDDFRVEFANLPDCCSNDEFLYGFASLMHYSAMNKALLPFHLPIYLLFFLSKENWIHDSDCKLLFQNSHAETWHKIKHLSEQELGALLSNDDNAPLSQMDYIRRTLLDDYNKNAVNLYAKLDRFSNQICPLIREMSVIDMDRYFSGGYSITAESFLRICNLNAELDKMIQSNWESFIYSCSESEIRKILILFTNSLALDPIHFRTVSNQTQDVEIFTCMRSVSIKKAILENTKCLSILKSYFIQNDSISDGTIQSEFDENDMNVNAENEYFRYDDDDELVD